ncbi:MAG TPA: YceI family protein [Balneolaceae bacterium]|nr:YceI family protein [Balneolaceae bacterium]
MKSLLTTILIFFLTALSSVAQTSNNYVVSDKSSMEITGTSTIHDWEAEVSGIQSTIDFNANALSGDTKSSPVSSLSITIPVKKIDSGKGGMNNKIYGALKEKKYPNITFTLSKTELSNDSTFSANDFQLTATGMLNIAGVSREVTVPVEGQLQSDGSYKFSGKYQLKMTDYKVDPPSAIFGTIKSGDEVTVSFDIYVSQQQS